MKIFEYSSYDVEHFFDSKTKTDSQFDKILLSEWSRLMNTDGIFKFRLDHPLPTRILSGEHKFVVQQNSKRYSEKRPSQIQTKSDINIPFDDGKFNFNKIKSQEFLLKLNHLDENKNFNDDFIIINNSPIEQGHCLIVPKLHSNQNQVLNIDSVKLAVDLMLLSASTNIVIGYNSVQAYASVNHLHMHLYYLNSVKNESGFPFPIQIVSNAQKLSQYLWFLNEEITLMPAFSVQLSDFDQNLLKFSKFIYLIIEYFVQKNLPHNLVLVKSSPYGVCSEQVTVRAVVWPKRPACDVVSNNMGINFAMCELAGHFFLPNDEDFDKITEEFLFGVANDAKLDSIELEIIKQDLVKIFN
ncbi:GDP-D-glucose phosphorylase 1-like [Brachionus plicatilis]|uniref:GDP-D-glucose phosphorylase 1 n=1 Tax=Brachionus plicatilis TaxID=10195 RepID=A0A3M7PTF9_BRAPC|nr:GDP-D-glucose phosphorylase 1-like [Brachionus plicatilis]